MQSLKLSRYFPNNLDRVRFSLLSRNINSRGVTAVSIAPLSSGHYYPYSGLLRHRHVVRAQYRSVAMAPSPVKYLAQQEAIDLDQELFNEYQFSVDQLMEMAGISCAVAIARHYPHLADASGGRTDVLIVCGPGNNGGDGLVCARHLRLFGFHPSVYYPVQKAVPLYTRLAHQCRLMGVTVEEQPPADMSRFGLVVDALFGFSFRPPVRPQMEPAMQLLKAGSPDTYSVCSIDVPSGWHVEEGPADAGAVQPDLLVSLTAPKLCAKFFKGAHYLGGRFVPPSLAKKYALSLPEFPGTDCVVQLN